MKLFCILFLLLTSFICCYSQQDFASIAVRVRNPEKAFGITDSSGSVYIFEGHKQYHISFLNKNGKEGQNFIVTKNNKRKRDELIGGTFNNDKIISFFYNKKEDFFSSLIVNRSNGSYNYHDLKDLPPNEQFLSAFTMSGKFYFLSVPKQKNILNIYSSQGDSISTSTFGIEMSSFYANLSSNNEQLNELAESSVGIETIRNRLDNNLKSTYPKKKLYFENDKIIMSFDEPNSTHLVIIDLKTSKSSYKKLNFNLEKGNNASLKKGNSYFLNNKIYRTTISPEMMNISIIDLDSFKLVNSFNSYPDKDITISNGPILQEGGTSFVPTEEKVIYKTRQYFNRVLDGNIAIVSNKIDSNKVEVEVGSYEEIITRGTNSFGAPGFGMGGFGVSMGLGYGPGMYYNPWGGFGSFNRGFNGYPGFSPYSNTSVRIRFISFKSLLEDQDFEHLEGEPPMTLRAKINEFIEKNLKNQSPELHTITALNEKSLLMGYYKKSHNKYDILYFQR